MKRFLSTILILFTLSCSSVRHCLSSEAEQNAAMMDSTVRIVVSVKGTDAAGIQGEEKWSGSGVTYAKTDGSTSKVHSMVLSANHVLATPKVDSTVIGMDLMPVHIDSVEFTVYTNNGQTCSLTPVAMGGVNEDDVAIGEVDCDTGTVAEVATREPPVGGRIYVSGHPYNTEVAVLTEGFVRGWLGEYLALSAAAAPGNSGGPVFYEGQVIGILVRGADYIHNTLSVPLSEVLKRIGQAESHQ